MRSQRDEAAEEALSILAHELQTPLTAIRGFAELLHARDDEHTRREASARILEAAERLAAAIERLLETVGKSVVLMLALTEVRPAGEERE